MKASRLLSMLLLLQTHERMTSQELARRSDQNLRSVWHDLVTSFEPTPGVEVHALLRSTRLDLAQRILGTRMAGITHTEDTWTPITVRYPDIESVRQLLQFGDHIRILSPTDAVRRFHDIAAQIMQNHRKRSYE